MKLNEFINDDAVISYDDELDLDISCKPVSTAKETNGESLLFLYKRLSGGRNVSPVEISVHPIAIVCEAEDADGFEAIPKIIVNDARAAFSTACFMHYCGNLDGIKLIGVTGTNGKTTTASLIFEILKYSRRHCGFIGTGMILLNDEKLSDVDYSMTTPDPAILYHTIGIMKERGVEYIVMEVSSHSLSLGKLTPLRFDASIMTNLSEEHMDFHTNVSDYLTAKEKLFNISKLGIFNIDDYYARLAYSRASCRKISVGAIQCADVNVRDLEMRGFEGSSFIYRGRNMMFKTRLGIVGYHNVYNAVLALTVAIALGIKPCDAKRGIESIKQINGRCQVIRDDITVIIDYAHTPYAFENLMRFVFSTVNAGQNIISVFGCGGNRDRIKRKEMTEIALKYSSTVIITEDNVRLEGFRSILNDMLCAYDPMNKITVIQDRIEAVRTAIISAKADDVVLLIGKGSEEYIIDSDGYREYSEINTALDALESRRSAVKCE